MSRGTSAITGKGLNQSREDDNTLHFLPSQCLLASLSLLLNFQAEAFHHDEKMKRFLVDPCNLTQRMNSVCISFASYAAHHRLLICLQSKRMGEKLAGKNGPGP